MKLLAYAAAYLLLVTVATLALAACFRINRRDDAPEAQEPKDNEW